MGTTADKLNKLLETKTAIKEAIEAKGIEVADTDTFRSYADKIGEIKGSSLSAKENDLTFYDYDGSILYSFSKEEVVSMTEMPEPPSHQGLIFDAWSNTLDEIKQYVAEYGKWGVGAFYDTDDNTARLYITLTDKDKLTITTRVYCRWNSKGLVDWGDGNSENFEVDAEVFVLEHTYDNIGDYIIRFKYISGDKFGLTNTKLNSQSSEACIFADSFSEDPYYFGILRKVEMNKKVYLEHEPFNMCRNLETITFPYGAYSQSSIWGSTFNGCYALKHLCIYIYHGIVECDNCVSLKTAILRRVGTDYSGIIEFSFVRCTALEAVYANHFTMDALAFDGCTNVKHVITLNKNIYGYAFNGCTSLKKLHPDVVKLMENTLNARGGHFKNCKSLENVTLSQDITSLEYSVFDGCVSLSHLVIPTSVTSLLNRVFANCSCLQYVDFSEHTSVPTLGTEAFDGVPASCKIYVPSSLLKQWRSATNWSTYTSLIVPVIDITECTSLDIEAEDITGNDSSVLVTYTAVVNGYHKITGEYIEGATVIDYTIIDVPKNPSQTDSIERQISFEYYGTTAITTIIQSPYVDYKIVCKYNVTSTTSATQLFYSSFTYHTKYFSYMLIDGVEYPIASTHIFSTTGEHDVVFKVKDDSIRNSNFYQMFRNISSLIAVDCTMLDMSLATSTSSSSGTASMFSGCTNLKTIILPDTVKYLGYYMFYRCVNVTSLTIKASTAPTLYGGDTWCGTPYSLGYSNRSNGTNKFYVPIGSTGYVETGSWSYLYNTSYCGFTKEEVENL